MTRVHSNDEVGSFPRFQKYLTRAGVEAEDAGMKISEWVSRKRKLMWMARFGAEIAKHNAPMISRSQNISEHLISVHCSVFTRI